MNNENLILKIPEEKRLFECVDGNFHCYFGVPNFKQNYKTLVEIPPIIKSLNIFDSKNVLKILTICFKMGINEVLEELTIGYISTRDVYGDNSKNDIPPNYKKITELLSNFSFPKLKYLNYGEEILYVNRDYHMSHLGNLTSLLSNIPVIETLCLSGSFELTTSINLNYLTHIDINTIPQYTEIRLLNESLNYFLKSKFGRINYFCLGVENNDDNIEVYQIPKTFYDQLKNSKLHYFEVAGEFFEKGTITQLEKSISKLDLNKKYIEIEEY